MKVDIFDFDLDKSLIANQPANPRDASKLLDLSNPPMISDKHFYDLPDLLDDGDVLVFNNTKVIPARMLAQRGEAKLEITLYRPVSQVLWWAFIKNSKRLKIDDVIVINNSDFTAKIIEKKGDEGVLLEFLCAPEDVQINLNQHGFMPLPPYIKRDAKNENDFKSYQTIYAKHEGAVAAPTAGLHFTDEVFAKLEAKGVKKVFLTLHVGAGTFLPVKVENTENHKMHSEYGIITQDVCDTINEAKKNGKKVIAVGTTSLRVLETVADETGFLKPWCGDTDIFITPGYKFKVIDYIITNFHLPKSTLFMLISAIAGLDFMQGAYKHAMDNGYRFYSYGDSSIIKVKR
ncbi:MAG: tRNA preQ1(34) S-adenosylmethionine ribosyltransferase-isomerase QueA [Alphaproteobacteria bacterium]